MAGFSIRSPGFGCFGISVLLLIIFLQILMVHFVVLVAFGLLSMIFAAYGKDRTTLKCSFVCQAASSLLTLGGIILFLIRYRSYRSWKDMALWFYLCVGVDLQLIVATVLTRVLGRTLTSDWK